MTYRDEIDDGKEKLDRVTARINQTELSLA